MVSFPRPFWQVRLFDTRYTLMTEEVYVIMMGEMAVVGDEEWVELRNGIAVGAFLWHGVC